MAFIAFLERKLEMYIGGNESKMRNSCCLVLECATKDLKIDEVLQNDDL